jgi:ABC-2 type transport system permease protein
MVCYNTDGIRFALTLWLLASLLKRTLLALLHIGLSIAAVVMTPLFLVGVVWLVLPMLLLGWLQRQWLQWLSEPFLSLFQWDEAKLQRASEKARIWGAFPPLALWGLIIGIRLGLTYGYAGWIAIVVLPVIGYFWIQMISIALTFLNDLRRKKNE